MGLTDRSGGASRSAREIAAIPQTIGKGVGFPGMDAAGRQRRRRLASRAKEDLARDRLPGVFLATLIVCVQLAWAGVLVYLGFRFL